MLMFFKQKYFIRRYIYSLDFCRSLGSGFPPQEEMSVGSFLEQQLVIEPSAVIDLEGS